MNKHEIELKLGELKGKQSEVFKLKKDKRDLDALNALREEMQQLKAQLKDSPQSDN